MYKYFTSVSQVFFAILLLMVSTIVYAGNAVDSEKPWLKPPDEKRAYVFIKNDYSASVKLSMWNKRGAQVGEYWVLLPGQSGYLTESGQKVAVSGEYTLKVGNDPGEAEVAEVSERHGKTWNVSVKKVWRETHKLIRQ